VFKDKSTFLTAFGEIKLIRELAAGSLSFLIIIVGGRYLKNMQAWAFKNVSYRVKIN
jgi:hypothetical protein